MEHGCLFFIVVCQDFYMTETAEIPIYTQE